MGSELKDRVANLFNAFKKCNRALPDGGEAMMELIIDQQARIDELEAREKLFIHIERAAKRVLATTDKKLDKEVAPFKWVASWKELTMLRKALAAKQALNTVKDDTERQQITNNDTENNEMIPSGNLVKDGSNG